MVNKQDKTVNPDNAQLSILWVPYLGDGLL